MAILYNLVAEKINKNLEELQMDKDNLKELIENAIEAIPTPPPGREAALVWLMK